MAVDFTDTGDASVMVQGVTTLRWGTNGLFANVIVEAAEEEEDVEEVYIEQSSAVKSTRFLIKHGKTYTFVVADDTTIFAAGGPTAGTAISLTDMLASGSTVVRATGVVTKPRYTAARKAEGKRIITVSDMTLVDHRAPGFTPLT
jgi:hypothetical protein